MALREHVDRPPARSARLEALVAAGVLPAELATDLGDSLHFLMGLRLQGRAGRDRDGPRRSAAASTPSASSSLERDLLKDALAVVKRFKALVRLPVPPRRRLTVAMMPRWSEALRRRWLLYHLADPQFAFMYDPPPDGEWVALDCETTGLDVHRDQIISIGAVRIVGNRLLTSQRLELLVRPERALKARERARAPAARARRRAGHRPRKGDAPAARFHRQPAAGRLLPRVRRGDAQPRDLAAARRAAAAAEDRGLGDVLRLARTASCRRTSAATARSTCASRR